MLDHCGKIDHHDYEQIQRMSEAFLHPKQILLEAQESLIINGVNIFEDTREGLHDYRMGKWLDAGEHFGQAAAMLLYGKTQMTDHDELFFDFGNHWQELLDQIDHEKDEKMHKFEAMKSSNVHFTFFRMGKILEGLLAGSVEAEGPHGVECLRDAKHIWERFGGVIDQLKIGTFNSVLQGMEDLGKVIHDIANELEECKATVGTDLDKLREMSKAFTDPWYFIFHVEHDLIVNGQDIHHEIMDAEAQWENQHFYEFGHSVGLSLSKIFLGGQMKNGIPANELPKGDNDTTYTVVKHDVTVHEHPVKTTYHYTPAWYANENKEQEANTDESGNPIYTHFSHGYVPGYDQGYHAHPYSYYGRHHPARFYANENKEQESNTESENPVYTHFGYGYIPGYDQGYHAHPYSYYGRHHPARFPTNEGEEKPNETSEDAISYRRHPYYPGTYGRKYPGYYGIHHPGYYGQHYPGTVKNEGDKENLYYDHYAGESFG